MARLFKEKPPLGDLRTKEANANGGAAHRISSTTTVTAVASGNGASLPSPFGELDCDLSPGELRETAYEIFVAACRSTGGRPLTYISQSERNSASAEDSTPDASSSLTTTSSSSSFSSSSLHKSLTSTAASKVKKALGIKSSSSLARKQSEKEGRLGRGSRTVAELVRVQMGVSEQTDTRIRRGLLRIAAGQLGRRIESMVLPLEILQQFKESDFPNYDEYEAWKFRNLKILEAGLLLHPHLPLDKADPTAQKLRHIIRGATTRPLDTGRNSEGMQVLRDAVMPLACRSFDGTASETCHWADGLPLNLHLYKMLLQVCFDKNEEVTLIEELDEVLEQIKKTWTVLGVDQLLHNLCFTWVLFQQFVSGGQVDCNLAAATDNQLADVLEDSKATKDPVYSKILNSLLASILGWVEKRLLAYHQTFHAGNIESFHSVASLGISTAKILAEDLSQERNRKQKEEEVDVARGKVETYIRSSIRAAFSQRIKQVEINRQSSNTPVLSILATEVGNLAIKEKEFFSLVLKKWHPLAAGVAVATLHSCYGKELKQFISGVKELSPDTIQILVSADKLEKQLVEIAVEDAVDSEDGGKGIIREMPPYEAESAVANLAKTWVKSRLAKLQDWVNRNIKQETWNPGANKENFAASAVEILRIVDDALESFFQLPMSLHASVLPDLIAGLDQSLQNYVSKAKSGCGARSNFVPALPSLTRCSGGSKLWKKKKTLNPQKKRSQVGSVNSEGFSLPQLFVRMNTLNHIRTEVENFEKRILTLLKKVDSAQSDVLNGLEFKFQLTASTCQEGIQQLCEATAYRIVFIDLSPVLWEGLYLGDPTISRIDALIKDLDPILARISSSVHDRVRNRAITALMKACFDGFLLVLLAGGPFRAFYCEDSQIIEEDFIYLRDLFLADGDGIPEEVVEKGSIQVKNVLPLFRMDTASLIERFKQVITEAYGPATKSKLPLPQTSGKWSPNEPNTILRVLCHRNDEMASKFLKKTYGFPSNV